MSKSRPRDHTVLPRWHLRDYFCDRGFKIYDLQSRKWKGRGPNTLGTIRGYYEPEIERELGKIEDNALPGVRKLAKRCILSDEDRQHVAWYIVASLFRNPTLFDELLPEMLDNVKRTLHYEEVADGLDTTQHEVDTYVGQTTSDAGFQREMHGAWFDNAPEYRLIAENIYDLSWHILYVARKPNYLLLTDRPFLVRFPTRPTKAEFTFPISSEVMLYINYDPRERWYVQPIERKDVIAHDRNLIAMAGQFVAVPKQDDPKQDEKLVRMIERVRTAKRSR